MKLQRLFVAVLSLAAAAAGLGTLEFAVPDAHAAPQLYTCGMHPQVIKTEPGDCPICGMKLTPIRSNAAAAAPTTASGERRIKFYKSTMIPGEVSPRPGKDSMGMDMVPVYEGDFDAAAAITIDPITIQKMNLKTDVVREGPVRRTIRVVGTVAFNEQGLADITTKYEGWIEKLLVNATWTPVKAGAALFEIYSPDLYNAQLNFLVALRSEGEQGGPLTSAARSRLRLFDVPDAFVAELARTGAAQRTITYRAATDGIVIEKPAVQGMMVRAGERILRLADLSSVWVNAQIYEKDLALIREGQPAVVRSTYDGDRQFEGTVDLIIPEVVTETRTAQARLTIANPELALKPGMFVDVRFDAELSPSAVLVSDLAVLRSGERNTVFIARDGGTFEPREVQLGARTQGNFYEVKSGLVVGDRVVTSGQFMLDSESQLRAAVQKMIRAAEASTGGVAAAAAATPTGSAKPVPQVEQHPLAADAQAALRPMAMVAADAAAALATDDLETYQTHGAALRSALEEFLKSNPGGPLARFKGQPAATSDLDAARREFEPLSTAVVDVVRANHVHHLAGLHAFECPMSPVLGKGRWLQRGVGVRNPFFGGKMLRCGEELDAPSAPNTIAD